MDDQKPPYQPPPYQPPQNQGGPNPGQPYSGQNQGPYQAPPTAPHYGGGFGTAPYMGGPGYDAMVPYGGDESVLATRGARFAARLLDTLILLLFAVPGFVMLLMQDRVDTVQPMPFILIGAGVLAIEVYQWIRIVRTGQTLGKSATNIKVVKTDGSPVGFLDGVIAREWVLSCLGVIPIIGRFIGPVDAVMIFGDERLCLHDRIASTKVIAVLPQILGG